MKPFRWLQAAILPRCLAFDVPGPCTAIGANSSQETIRDNVCHHCMADCIRMRQPIPKTGEAIRGTRDVRPYGIAVACNGKFVVLDHGTLKACNCPPPVTKRVLKLTPCIPARNTTYCIYLLINLKEVLPLQYHLDKRLACVIIQHVPLPMCRTMEVAVTYVD